MLQEDNSYVSKYLHLYIKIHKYMIESRLFSNKCADSHFKNVIKQEAGASISTTLCNFGHWPANGKHCIAFHHSDSLTCNYFHIRSFSLTPFHESRSPLTSPGIQPCVSNALMLHSHCHRIPLHCTSLQNNCALYCPFLMPVESIWDAGAKPSTDDQISSFLCL